MSHEKLQTTEVNAAWSADEKRIAYWMLKEYGVIFLLWTDGRPNCNREQTDRLDHARRVAKLMPDTAVERYARKIAEQAAVEGLDISKDDAVAYLKDQRGNVLNGTYTWRRSHRRPIYKDAKRGYDYCRLVELANALNLYNR